jgi:ADP-glucose pyrophosphorylase
MRERDREFLNAKQAQRKSEHTDEEEEGKTPREKSLSHHKTHLREKPKFVKKNLSKKAPQFDIYFFKNNILSSSLQKRAQQNTTHHPLEEKKKKRAKYTTRLPLTTHRYRRRFRYQ